jgi:hypothetical protein
LGRNLMPSHGREGTENLAISSMSVFVILIFVVVVVSIVVGLTPYRHGGNNEASTTSTTSTIQGIVAGYVTVGPSQPVCSANQSCTVNVTGYSLEFTSRCSGTSTTRQTQKYLAAIAPSGHYSILLPAGNYSISGLYPSCSWVGCSSAFPKAIVVESGIQLVVNVNIDTGIR